MEDAVWHTCHTCSRKQQLIDYFHLHYLQVLLEHIPEGGLQRAMDYAVKVCKTRNVTLKLRSTPALFCSRPGKPAWSSR